MTVLQSTLFGKELTKIMNNRGPRIEPCGTQLLMFLKSDIVELIFTA